MEREPDSLQCGVEFPVPLPHPDVPDAATRIHEWSSAWREFNSRPNLVRSQPHHRHINPLFDEWIDDVGVRDEIQTEPYLLRGEEGFDPDNLRRNKWSPDCDRATVKESEWSAIYGYFTSHFAAAPFMLGAQDVTENDFPTDTCSGLPWKRAGLKTKADVLGLFDPEVLADAGELSIKAEQSIIYEFAKLESIKREKEVRTIMCYGLDVHCAMVRHFKGFANCVKNMKQCRIGFSKWRWGVQNLLSPMEKFSKKFECDARRFDSTLPTWAVEVVLYAYFDRCPFMDQELIQKIIRAVTHSDVWSSNGEFYQKRGGNPSGLPITSELNTAVHLALFLLTYLRKHGTLVGFDSLELNLYGDDVFGANDGELLPADLLTHLGDQPVKYPAESIIVQDTLEGLTFLGCTFYRSGKNWLWRPAKPNKMLCTLKYSERKNASRDLELAKVRGLLLECAWDQKLWNTLVGYQSWLEDRNASVSDPILGRHVDNEFVTQLTWGLQGGNKNVQNKPKKQRAPRQRAPRTTVANAPTVALVKNNPRKKKQHLTHQRGDGAVSTVRQNEVWAPSIPKGFSVHQFRPGKSGCRFLDQSAKGYELYRVRDASIHFKTGCGLSTSGTMVMGVDYNPDNIRSEEDVRMCNPNVSGGIQRDYSISLNVTEIMKGKKWLKTSDNDAFAVYFSSTSDDATTIGQLNINYSIEFSTPLTSATGGVNQDSAISTCGTLADAIITVPTTVENVTGETPVVTVEEPNFVNEDGHLQADFLVDAPLGVGEVFNTTTINTNEDGTRRNMYATQVVKFKYIDGRPVPDGTIVSTSGYSSNDPKAANYMRALRSGRYHSYSFWGTLWRVVKPLVGPFIASITNVLQDGYSIRGGDRLGYGPADPVADDMTNLVGLGDSGSAVISPTPSTILQDNRPSTANVNVNAAGTIVTVETYASTQATWEESGTGSSKKVALTFPKTPGMRLPRKGDVYSLGGYPYGNYTSSPALIVQQIWDAQSPANTLISRPTLTSDPTMAKTLAFGVFLRDVVPGDVVITLVQSKSGTSAAVFYYSANITTPPLEAPTKAVIGYSYRIPATANTAQ
nr:MAG: RNA-dependent RNA polymerase [Mite astrovirus]